MISPISHLQKSVSVAMLAIFTVFTATDGRSQESRAFEPDPKPLLHTGRIYKPRLVIHGGAGVILRQEMSPVLEAEYRKHLSEALQVGWSILEKEGSSLDAVEAVVRILEDSPLFNAGKGSVFTHEGTNELDAAIMDGKTLSAGSVAAVKRIKNPISLARAVMEKSRHVMMIGEGAEVFAAEQGFDFVPPEYFFTERRWKQLENKRASEKRAKDSLKRGTIDPLPVDSTDGKKGTVGCVALDAMGNLAAGTSTGGTTNKRFGRVGDTPIIGAGTYADNASCAVSATGDGEYFIRATVARDVAALVEYQHMTVADAAAVAIARMAKLGGTGGVIVLDRDGRIAINFNTPGMYRAYIDEFGKPVVQIYRE